MENETSRILPPEILLHVLRLLALSGYVGTLAFKRSSERFGEDLLKKLTESQRNLYRCTLVCRDWYSSGMEVLYLCPYILSPKQLRLFTETLGSKPELLALVKSAMVADDQYTLSSIRGTRDSGAIDRSKDLSFVLASCPYLTEITIYPNSDLISTPHLGPVALPWSPTITRRLGRINFCGPGLYNLNPHHTFGSLEVIYINTGTVMHPLVFPDVPKLHTLQLAKTFACKQPVAALATGNFGDCKTLRTLELYLNTPSKVMEFSPLTRPQLERLHLIGHAEGIHFDSWSKTNGLDNLRYLVIGVLADGKHAVQSWVFPNTLVELTCFVRIRPSMTADDGPLHSLLRCFRLNAEVSPTRAPPHLVIYLSPDSILHAPHEEVLRAIQEIGVTLERRYAAWDSWVSERLLSPVTASLI